MKENPAYVTEDDFALFPRPVRDPGSIMEQMIEEHSPYKIVAMTSGGTDSTAAMLAVREYIDLACYIDTGTALPGVREHVERVCDQLGVELRVYETPWAEYEAMVLEHGFPGPGQHQKAYIRLKERRVWDLLRDLKTHRMQTIGLVTGVRATESTRRMGTTKPIQKQRGMIWTAPIIDWSKRQTQDIARAAGIGPSEVSALIHRSGECNCGAFAATGEAAMLKSLWPEWWTKFERLESKARIFGKPCAWGERPAPPAPTVEQIRRDIAAPLGWAADDPLDALEPDEIADIEAELAKSDEQLLAEYADRRAPRVGPMCVGCEQVDLFEGERHG